MSVNSFNHTSVMLNEAVESLNCQKDLVYIDGTLGGGGHSKLIASKGVNVISLDIDDDAIMASREKLKDLENIKIIKESYRNIPKVLQNLDLEKITGGVLLDLGASYHQLTSAERGFSFRSVAPLDMRFDKNQTKTAYDVVNSYSEKELEKIIKDYGEERFARRVAKKIVFRRSQKPLETTKELSDLVISAIPNSSKQKIHPATRTFQAIRMEVNDEIGNIKTTLFEVVHLLEKGARIVVLTFHSIEDRAVKTIFKEYSKKCRCPITEPFCKCTGAQLRLITKKPVLASEEEIKNNPPSRSVKMRVVEKI